MEATATNSRIKSLHPLNMQLLFWLFVVASIAGSQSRRLFTPSSSGATKAVRASCGDRSPPSTARGPSCSP